MSTSHTRARPVPEPAAKSTTVTPRRLRRDGDQVPSEHPTDDPAHGARAEAAEVDKASTAAEVAQASASPDVAAEAAPDAAAAADLPVDAGLGGGLANNKLQVAGLGLLGLTVVGAAAGGGGGSIGSAGAAIPPAPAPAPTPSPTPEQRPPEGQSPDGAKPDGTKPDGQQPGGQMPDAQQPGGQTPGGQTPEGQQPGGQTPDPQQPGGQTPGGQTPDGQQPGGQTPNPPQSDGQTPGGQTPGPGPGPDVTLPTPPAKPALALVNDTGISATDGLTKDGTIQVDGILPGNTWKYSVDGGATWVTGGEDHRVPGASFPTDGEQRVQVMQFDAYGQPSEVGELPFHLDRTGPEGQPVVVLANDTFNWAFPANIPDRITSDGTLNIGGLNASTPWSYSIDGGAWVPGVGSQIPNGAFAKEGLHTVQVKQTDVAGNDGTIASFEFTLDRVVAPNSITFDRVSKIADGQLVTNGSKLLIEGLEDGAIAMLRLNSDAGTYLRFSDRPAKADHPLEFSLKEVEFQAQGGVLKQGVNTLDVFVTHVSDTSEFRRYTFIYDTLAPDAPTIALKHDDGASSTDKLTSDGTLVITGLEKEASWKYSLDGGKTWDKGTGNELSGTVFTAAGAQSVQVIQTDLAGNDSKVQPFEFTLVQPPLLPPGGNSVI
ncbi:hypothetical protein [Mitsuaria sp. GD03876]|uniref:hypothetical protein n=1 Tax=Mitsuaria sp. GD03876 TaxID=2975399 RepID=UPI00244C0AB3|nr:hypothetical protein [Mitsuaria sp. GD03876]MDH0867468.1 hypothetical protein [Mitsuaria sp. GD03876]